MERQYHSARFGHPRQCRFRVAILLSICGHIDPATEKAEMPRAIREHLAKRAKMLNSEKAAAPIKIKRRLGPAPKLAAERLMGKPA